MGILQIREAKKAGSRTVIGLAGPSGAGKTYTALLLAYGMVNQNAKKIGLLDTENKRGSLYADILKTPNGDIDRFLIGDLHPPFSPSRYSEAIKEFEASGIEVLVIDSVTHEWESIGGCDEIANNTSDKMANWKLAKREHKAFMSTMLQCDMHIIVCIRAREKTSYRNPKALISLGIQPIQEKNFMYEMTASMMLCDEGKSQNLIKMPEDLRPILGRRDGYLGVNDGVMLRDWVAGIVPEDREVERWKNKLLMNTNQGIGHIQECWGKVPVDMQTKIGEPFRESLFEAAKGYDDMNSQNGQDGDNTDLAKKLSSLKPKEPASEILAALKDRLAKIPADIRKQAAEDVNCSEDTESVNELQFLIEQCRKLLKKAD